jgi:hypothetical protein
MQQGQELAAVCPAVPLSRAPTSVPCRPGVPALAPKSRPQWFGLFAPKGTPYAIVGKLNAEFSAIIKSPEFADPYLIAKGFSPVGNTSEELARFMVEDQKRGKLLVDISGAKLEQEWT